jgi:hypothetical protein
MKIYNFKQKLPELGCNIIVIHESSCEKITYMGICEFDLTLRKHILKDDDNGCYFPQDYYTDDPSEDRELDIRSSDYWCYPSSIKLPKKNQKNLMKSLDE